MSNPILDAVENINSAFEEFKTTNDERLEAEQKGNEARARELSEKLDRIERDIVSHEKAKKEEERKAAILQERVEILESINDRPGKTAEEKAKDEYAEWFWKGIRSKFQDDEATRGMRGAVQKMREYGSKSISIGTAGDGGHALPEEISRSIDSLMLKQSDILNEIKFIEVGSSDYKELLSINSTGAAWSAEGGTRSEQTTPTLRQFAPCRRDLTERRRGANCIPTCSAAPGPLRISSSMSRAGSVTPRQSRWQRQWTSRYGPVMHRRNPRGSSMPRRSRRPTMPAR